MLVARDLWVRPPGGAEPVVRGVSLEVRRGEWLGVAGPNGCGKTTLALALAGLAPAHRGAVTWDGAPLAGGGRREVAAVLQEPSSQLFERTVADELAWTARNLGRDEASIARDAGAFAERAGLGADLGRDPAVLSAGRQQAVLIGAALVSRPALLVADEPAAHLDGAARAAVLALVRERVREGLAVVWVTQEPPELAAADRRLELPGPGPGPDPARLPGPADAAATGRAGSPALTLRVAPGGAGEGPRVRADRAFEVPVAAGAVTGLTGPNGAGKSVLLAVAAGLLEIPQVSREAGGLHGPPPILCGQYPELQMFEERVEDELLYAALRRGRHAAEARAEMHEALRDAGFDAGVLLARRAWTLSSGEKRVVAVLSALLAPACLVALDEPTAGLDPLRRRALANRVRRRARLGPVLVATQDEEWLRAAGADSFRVG